MKGPFPMVRPGMFGSQYAADSRRLEFDLQNEQLLFNERSIDFIFIGDSITHFWDLASFFARHGKVIVNKGISGDQSTPMGKRFEADVLQLRPRHVVMKIGINNCWAMDAWVPEERKTADQIRVEVVADIQDMAMRASDRGIIPILCSILPTCLDVQATMDAKNELVLAINRDLKDFAADKSLYLCGLSCCNVPRGRENASFGACFRWHSSRRLRLPGNGANADFGTCRAFDRDLTGGAE